LLSIALAAGASHKHSLIDGMIAVGFLILGGKACLNGFRKAE
jgi:hypothetical protein